MFSNVSTTNIEPVGVNEIAEPINKHNVFRHQQHVYNYIQIKSVQKHLTIVFIQRYTAEYSYNSSILLNNNQNE